jgi:hypothetical protein
MMYNAKVTLLWATQNTQMRRNQQAEVFNPLCTKLIIWQDSSTCHHNKTPTEKG